MKNTLEPENDAEVNAHVYPRPLPQVVADPVPGPGEKPAEGKLSSQSVCRNSLAAIGPPGGAII